MPQTSLDYLGSICGEIAAPQWFPFAEKILAGPSMVLSIWARSLFAN
jgi:hypothetical protein